MGIAIEIGFIVLLTLANGFFAASEIALVSVKRGRLEQQAAEGNKKAVTALALSRDPDRFLTTVQIGITLVSTIAAAFGGARLSGALAGWLARTAWLAPYAEPLAFAIVVAGITWLSLVIGELVPKRIAMQYSERIARTSAPAMSMLAKMSRPLVSLLSGSVHLVLRAIGFKEAPHSDVTVADIVDLAREGQLSGAVEESDATLIRKVFSFSERPVKAAMTPRSDIVWIDVNASLGDVVKAFQTSGYSRLPVVEGGIDEVVGILYSKDILMAQMNADFSVRKSLRRASFVFENHRIDRLIGQFRRERSHMAIVVDEYGQVSGLITLEDVLEELVGEIEDEYDQPEPRAIVQREDGSWLVDASLAYEEAAESIGMPQVPLEDRGMYTTLAGLLLTRMGHIPATGESIEHGGFIIEVVDLDGRRIDKVMIRKEAQRKAG